MTDSVKHQDQRIREVEAEIVVLQLCCRDVMHAIKEAQGESPELRSVFARLFEKRLAAVAEWRRLNNIGSNSQTPCTDYSASLASISSALKSLRGKTAVETRPCNNRSAFQIKDGPSRPSSLFPRLLLGLDVLPPPRARARFNGQSRGPSCVPAASGLRGKTRSFAKQRDRLIGRRS
jgi:hypothetical protein